MRHVLKLNARTDEVIMNYKTRQHGEIVDFLKSMKGCHVTAADVCSHFEECGQKIGKATVYRQLERLVSEGVINKYIIDENSGACFEYVDRDSDCHEECYHCKCEKCGKLIHLECSEISQLTGHLSEHHGFSIDPRRTVFYGICDDCADGEHENARKDGCCGSRHDHEHGHAHGCRCGGGV